MAAKVAAAVVAVTVAVGATVIVINTTGDDPPVASQEPPPAASQDSLSVTTVTEQASYDVHIDVSAQVVKVSGVGNAATVNESLRAPVDARVRELRDDLGGIRGMLEDSDDERWDDPVTIFTYAKVLLQNADYLSVRYENEPHTGLISNSSWQSYDTVTVDLRTGKALTREQIYRPGSVGALRDAFFAHSSDRLCESTSFSDYEFRLTEDNLGDEVTVAFARDHASFTIELPAFNRANACGVRIVDIPYEDLTEVLDPTLVRGLTSG